MLPGSLSITAHSEDKILHTFTVGLFTQPRFNDGYLASELVLVIRNKLCKQPAHMKALNLIQSATCGYIHALWSSGSVYIALWTSSNSFKDEHD